MAINYDRHTQAFRRKYEVSAWMPVTVATIGALVICGLLILISFNYEMTTNAPDTQITAPEGITKPSVERK